jgi:membrane protein
MGLSEARYVGKLLKGIAGVAVAGVVAKRVKGEGLASPSSRRASTEGPAAPGSADEKSLPHGPSGDPEPDSPLDLEAADWKATVKRTLKEVKGDRVTLVAAGMAYYFFLAIFPALIALVGILNLANVDSHSLIDSIRSTLPGGAGTALTAAVDRSGESAQTASLVAAITGIFAALFSATSGMVAMQKGLDVAYDVEDDRKFLPARGVALVLLLATVVLGAVPSPIFTFGESAIFVVLGWILTVAAIMVLFSIYYYVGPKRDQPTWRWISAGGVIGGGLWILGSLGFGLYISNFNNYGKTYGPLAGVVVLILYLYLSSLAVLLGGELNAELERQARAS